jgi:hypothetical protein
MAAPVTFETATLGQAVTLGELYNANTSKFYGVQLYTQDSIDKATISTKRDPPFGDLSLSVASSFQDKANLFNVKAQLSLEVLAGTVSVSGSASYLKDTKATATTQAWNMTLKQLGREVRLVAGDSNLVAISNNVKGTYAHATHYVSAIRYGGNLVVQMIEEKSKLTDEQKISGHLEASLTAVKGAIELKGTIDLKIENKFSSLDGKFDLQVSEISIFSKTFLSAS